MPRRLLSLSSALFALIFTAYCAMPARAQDSQQLLELRTYHFASAEKLAAFENFAAEALIPALNRAGVEPVGMFKLLAVDNPDLKLAADSTDLIMLLPFHDAATMTKLPTLLDADEAYQAAGKSLLITEPANPAYTRVESSLLLAFAGVPRVEVPHQNPERVLQLRTYESHNADRALRKIEMFNEGGEIEIFRRVGIAPVFFGQALVGSKLPNLTYMASFASKEDLDKGWVAFRTDAAWSKLKVDPKYKDTVSNITNLILRPARGSQI